MAISGRRGVSRGRGLKRCEQLEAVASDIGSSSSKLLVGDHNKWLEDPDDALASDFLRGL